MAEQRGEKPGRKPVAGAPVKRDLVEAVKEVDGADALQAMRTYFKRRAEVEGENPDPEVPFSADDFAHVPMLLDIDSGKITISEMTPEKAVSLGERYGVAGYLKLQWLEHNGYIESVGQGGYQLTSDGKAMIAPRH